MANHTCKQRQNLWQKVGHHAMLGYYFLLNAARERLTVAKENTGKPHLTFKQRRPQAESWSPCYAGLLFSPQCRPWKAHSGKREHRQTTPYLQTKATSGRKLVTMLSRAIIFSSVLPAKGSQWQMTTGASHTIKQRQILQQKVGHCHIIVSSMLKESPWYHRTGWLGVKTPSYLLTLPHKGLAAAKETWGKPYLTFKQRQRLWQKVNHHAMQARLSFYPQCCPWKAHGGKRQLGQTIPLGKGWFSSKTLVIFSSMLQRITLISPYWLSGHKNTKLLTMPMKGSRW